VLIASAEDLPLGAAVAPAHQQDSTFTQRALASVVVELPLDALAQPSLQWPVGQSSAVNRAQRRRHRRRFCTHLKRERGGRLSRPMIGKLTAELQQGQDTRALPYLRGDGSFAKIPAKADAKRQGFRLWAPAEGQSRRGLGQVHSAVERTHALLNQFGRIFRRLDRSDRNYLAWVHLASCIIYMRRGFFP
jgi:hypothetical protein